MIYRDATGAARLGKGTEGHVLTMGANDPAWAAAASGGVQMTTGTYSGANGSNRAIAHGLGAIPDLVIANAYGANEAYGAIIVKEGKHAQFWSSSTSSTTSAQTTTNFYVNQWYLDTSGTTYRWWAFKT